MRREIAWLAPLALTLAMVNALPGSAEVEPITPVTGESRSRPKVIPRRPAFEGQRNGLRVMPSARQRWRRRSQPFTGGGRTAPRLQFTHRLQRRSELPPQLARQFPHARAAE